MKMSSSPVIVGVAQFTQHKNTERPLDPLSLMVKTSADALSDSGVSGLKDFVDCVYVMNLFQWSYRDAPGMLSARLGINPRQASYLPVGGNSPQLIVNRATMTGLDARSLQEQSSRTTFADLQQLRHAYPDKSTSRFRP